MQAVILRVDGTSIHLELSDRAMRQVEKNFNKLMVNLIVNASTVLEFNAEVQVYRSAVMSTILASIEHVRLSNTAVKDLVQGRMQPSAVPSYMWKTAN